MIETEELNLDQFLSDEDEDIRPRPRPFYELTEEQLLKPPVRKPVAAPPPAVVEKKPISKEKMMTAVAIVALLGVGMFFFFSMNRPPKAVVTVSPADGDINTSFSFDASGSSDREDSASGLLVRWDWEGDGQWDTEYQSEKIADHKFDKAGNYSVVCQVRDSQGAATKVSCPVKVAEATAANPPQGENASGQQAGKPEPPTPASKPSTSVRVTSVGSGKSQQTVATVMSAAAPVAANTEAILPGPSIKSVPLLAAFSVTPISGTTNTRFHLDASACADPDDAVKALRVRWDFDADGQWDTGWQKDRIAEHTFANAGFYDITLEVMNTRGQVARISYTVQVEQAESRINPVDGATLYYVPEGDFLMGSTDGEGALDEQPQHRVNLKGFWIYRTEVTVKQFHTFCKETRRSLPAQPKWGWHDQDPIVNIKWQDAADYARWAGGRLPTEEEWEKAARGTQGTKYPWGDEWNSDLCNSRESKRGQVTAVGHYTKAQSPYAVLDMAGNVWEWCADWYDANAYAPGRTVLPPDSDKGTVRVLRGGSWRESARYCRAAARGYLVPNKSADNIGFRCAIGGPTAAGTERNTH